MSRAIEQLVIDKLRRGPRYAHAFRYVKPVVARLIASGKVERVAPPGLISKNMLRLVDPH